MHTTDTHTFAFFYESLKKEIETVSEHTSAINIQQTDLIHRIQHVLKMNIGEHCILFDHSVQVSGYIKAISKKEVFITITQIKDNQSLLPHITLYLPLLKRTALEEAVYVATECGVSEIHLITTKKSLARLSDHEFNRLVKISISACEQAKYFTIPPLYPPKTLSSIMADKNSQISTRIYFDPSGRKFSPILSTFSEKQQKTIEILIGPEGGLLAEEIASIQQQNFMSCALTPTILRAKTAVCSSISTIRTAL